MPALLAMVLVLDQRIELQLALVLLLAMVAPHRLPGTTWQPGKAAVVLLLAALYLAANAAATWTDPAGVPDSWWASPVRIWLYYVMLIAVATVVNARHFDADAVHRTLEWLFAFKLLVVGFEGYVLMQTGEPRERPFFNIVLDSDTLMGVRFTSSYDFLFALLALSPRHQVRRLAVLATAVLISETRALLLLSMLLLGWRLLRSQSPWALVATAAIPLAVAITVVAAIGSEQEATPRVVQLSGSSLDDKLEQIQAVGGLIVSPYLLTGRGVGASIPGIVRDELRPYSYEAQAPVLLWQGGLLFFTVHIAIICAYVRRHRFAAILLILGLSFLNPTLFSLASAFFLTALGKVLDLVHARRHDPHRSPNLHAQR